MGITVLKCIVGVKGLLFRQKGDLSHIFWFGSLEFHTYTSTSALQGYMESYANSCALVSSCTVSQLDYANHIAKRHEPPSSSTVKTPTPNTPATEYYNWSCHLTESLIGDTFTNVRDQ